MVDNILDMRYFETLIPELEARPRGPVIFYETKANLSRRQVGQLAARQRLLHPARHREPVEPGAEADAQGHDRHPQRASC